MANMTNDNTECKTKLPDIRIASDAYYSVNEVKRMLAIPFDLEARLNEPTDENGLFQFMRAGYKTNVDWNKTWYYKGYNEPNVCNIILGEAIINELKFGVYWTKREYLHDCDFFEHRSINTARIGFSYYDRIRKNGTYVNQEIAHIVLMTSEYSGATISSKGNKFDIIIKRY